ncbi:MAG: exodeoxyribonuclease III [Candidatus Pacebacteria bacterium]|nr:exodeoxyribonuclease III [Candidatus Paceibacterota bacterium]MBP9867026.1 exodeoxyribonuclease III [Candidatus Paceibacterota bacterium]
MKILSWNVNGIRAVSKKDAWQEVFSLSPDIVAIQETKATPEQLSETIINPKGYFSCFDSSKIRKGYSGVAIYSKVKPEKIEYGLGSDHMDMEGRLLTVHFKDVIVMNCYFPNGGKSEDHFLYKLEYYDLFLKRAKMLEKKKPVIFMGDINATVADIDLARPKENAGKLGCTEDERMRLAKFTDAFVDTFRYKHGDVSKYTWWDMKTRARERNVGWRIDYIFVSHSLQKNIYNADILDNVLGSDHCPVLLDIRI